jgi:hypothetical protein
LVTHNRMVFSFEQRITYAMWATQIINFIHRVFIQRDKLAPSGTILLIARVRSVAEPLVIGILRL